MRVGHIEMFLLRISPNLVFLIKNPRGIILSTGIGLVSGLVFVNGPRHLDGVVVVVGPGGGGLDCRSGGIHLDVNIQAKPCFPLNVKIPTCSL